MELIEHLLMKLISFGGIGFLIHICSRNKYIFKYSSEKFNTMHFNKILTCNNIEIIKRILRYIKLHPKNFNIIYSNLNIDNDLVSNDIKNIIKTL